MKIRPEIEIFDDPDICFVDEDNCCGQLIFQEFNLNMPYCPIYKENLSIFWGKEPVQYGKCDQCKADYLRAKRDARIALRYKRKNDDLNNGTKLSKLCPKCKQPRGEDEHGTYICPCPHCGDDIQF